MFATVQCGVATWLASNVGSSVGRNLGHPKSGDFEERAQQPTVHFNTQPTGSSDLRLMEDNFSHQSIAAPSDCANVFSHEPSSSTSAATAEK
jgi:hypothetical protein